jgi:tetratricopeptide (TPR) repeat protein
MRRFALLIGLVFATPAFPFPAPDRDRKDGEWVGKNVILRKASTTLFDKNNNSLGTLNRTDYFVIRDEGERVIVRDLLREGWVPKSELILTMESLQYLTEQINANPQDSYLYAKRSKAHEHKGNLEGALSDYNEAVRLMPTASGWINNRGNVYLKMRRFDKAIEDYSKSLEMNPNSSISFNNRALAYFNLRAYDNSLADYAKALQSDPEYTQARINRANCFRELKRMKEAQDDLEVAFRRDPKNASIPNQRAAIHIDNKEYDLAWIELRKALTLDPRSSWAYHHRGNIYRKQKRHIEAVWEFEHSLWLDPKSISTQTLKAISLRELKRFDEAKKEFEAVIKFDPNYHPALDGFALQLATAEDDKHRDGKNAAQLIAKAIELTKGQLPEYHATAAAVEAELGNFDAAIKSLEKALADQSLDEDDRTEYRRWLELFQAKKPLRK